ncbi:MAG: VacJ family lipoprotein [Syntrophobacteraceae bacterium]
MKKKREPEKEVRVMQKGAISKVVALILFAAVMFPIDWDGGRRTSWSIGSQDLALAATDDDSSADEPNFGEEPSWAESAPSVSDPLEPLNRAFFTFNDKLYFWFMKPVCQVYRTFVPTGVRTCISNANDNLMAPIRVVGNILQGKITKAGSEVSRFLINSTLGVGGMFDMAESHFHISAHKEDMGQTLGTYGMGPILYINWPVFGPSSLRDTIGSSADSFLNPLTYITPDWVVCSATTSGVVINDTSLKIGQYEDLKASALDPYVAVRDGYIQHRRKLIKE